MPLPDYRDGEPVGCGGTRAQGDEGHRGRGPRETGRFGNLGVEVEQGEVVGVTYGEGIPEGEVLLRR